MKQIYDFEPKAVETIISTGMTTTVIRLDITKMEDGTWECEEVEYNHKEPLSEKDYGHIISAVVRAKYTIDDVEAIQLNYMSSKNAKNEAKFSELRDWRVNAKRIARELISQKE
jgi:hypothetical protein